MASHYNLWIEYPADWRPLRDFLFDACKCTHFWTSQMGREAGRPDNLPREHYGVYNDYNMVDLLEGSPGSQYLNDVHVCYTLNDPDMWATWHKEVIEASIAWLARSTGDAQLDWDLLPILERKGAGPVIVNNFEFSTASLRSKQASSPDYQAVILNALAKSDVAYAHGCLKSFHG